jgi:hypothetical protein
MFIRVPSAVDGVSPVGPTACAHSMRVAHKDVTITKNTLFTAIRYRHISPWWPWLQVTKPAAGLRLTNLAILS